MTLAAIFASLAFVAGYIAGRLRRQPKDDYDPWAVQ